MKNDSYLQCVGNEKLEGVIKTSGSKNASLPIIASSLLCKEKVILHNVPDITDIRNFLLIINYLNVKTEFKNNILMIDSSSIEYHPLDIDEVRLLRGSYYLLPILLGITNEVEMINVGGCSFEERPMDIHFDVFSSFGINSFKNQKGWTFCKKTITNTDYTFNKKSVGATINAILLALQVEGISVIRNHSKEVEIRALIDFINTIGGNIVEKDDCLYIDGKRVLRGTNYNIIPDRIELESFFLFGLTNGRILLFDFIEKHHVSFLNFFESLSIKYEIDKQSIYVEKQYVDVPIVLTFGNENLVSSDISPLLMMYFIINGKKMCLFNDAIYPKRIYCLDIFKNGVFIRNDHVVINPRNIELKDNVLNGKNLRETMAYILYALGTNKSLKVTGLKYLYRGYEDVINKLISINGDINIYED